MNFMRRSGQCIGLLVLAIFALSANSQTVPSDEAGHAGATPDKTSAPATVQGAANEARSYSIVHLGPGDALGIEVFGLPELTSAAHVTDTGMIDLPLIGLVKVGGLTIEEARKAIEKKLRDGGFVNEPFVTVTPRDLPSQTVTMVGEVDKPGVYPLANNLTSQIALAGGLSQRAGYWVQIIHADDPDHPKKVRFEVESPAPKASEEPVEAGDTIVVNKAEFVYVLGDVNHASAIVLENDKMTVMQALSLAGGPASTATLRHAYILRRTGTKAQQVPIPLKEIITAKVEDPKMLPNDILFVAGSLGKSLYHGGLQQLFTAASIAAIVRP